MVDALSNLNCKLHFFFYRFFGSFCSGMGPDSRVLVRKSRKQAEQYYKLYKVLSSTFLLMFSLTYGTPILGQDLSTNLLAVL